MLKNFLMTGLMAGVFATGIWAGEPASLAETGSDAVTNAVRDARPQEMPGDEQPGLSPGSTQESFLIEISIPENSPGAEGGPAVSRVEHVAPKIIPEVDFQQSSFPDALRVISKQSGVPIDGGEDLAGTITLCLQDIPLDQLLFLLMKMSQGAFLLEDQRVRILASDAYQNRYGQPFAPEIDVAVMKLRYRTVEDIKKNLDQLESLKGHLFMDKKNQQLIVLDRKEPLEQMLALLKSWDMPSLATKTFPLQDVDPKTAAEKISVVLTENVGTVTVNEETREVTVTDLTTNFPRIELLLQALIQTPEIVWRLQMSRIQLNEEHQDGIDWEAIVSEYQEADVFGHREGGLPPEKNRLSIGTITKEDLPVLKDALDAAGQLIDLHDTTEVSGVKNDAIFILDTMKNPKNFRDPEGVAMTIKVRLKKADSEGFLVQLSPELTWLADNAPENNSSSTETFIPQDSIEISLDKHDVVVLGGLLREKELERTSKIPLLGDLPFLGFIFRSENRLILRTEYIIFLIPDLPESP
ncbi:MAG: hypothetical protein WC450_01850 [Candidatus Omnitrophota bacterium]